MSKNIRCQFSSFAVLFFAALIAVPSVAVAQDASE
ncbi:uncharacterized protein METZ01_LOCUS404342, partial [marine metagenome]